MNINPESLLPKEPNCSQDLSAFLNKNPSSEPTSLNEQLFNLKKSLNDLKFQKQQKEYQIINLLSNKETIDELYKNQILKLKNSNKKNKNCFCDLNDEDNFEITITEISESDQEKYFQQVSNLIYEIFDSSNFNRNEIQLNVYDIIKKSYEIINKEISTSQFINSYSVISNFFLRISIFLSNQSLGKYSETNINLLLRYLLKLNNINKKYDELIEFTTDKYKKEKKIIKKKMEQLLNLIDKNKNNKKELVCYNKKKIGKLICSKNRKIKDNNNNTNNNNNEDCINKNFISSNSINQITKLNQIHKKNNILMFSHKDNNILHSTKININVPYVERNFNKNVDLLQSYTNPKMKSSFNETENGNNNYDFSFKNAILKKQLKTKNENSISSNYNFIPIDNECISTKRNNEEKIKHYYQINNLKKRKNKSNEKISINFEKIRSLENSSKINLNTSNKTFFRNDSIKFDNNFKNLQNYLQKSCLNKKPLSIKKTAKFLTHKSFNKEFSNKIDKFNYIKIRNNKPVSNIKINPRKQKIMQKPKTLRDSLSISSFTNTSFNSNSSKQNSIDGNNPININNLQTQLQINIKSITNSFCYFKIKKDCLNFNPLDNTGKDPVNYYNFYEGFISIDINNFSLKLEPKFTNNKNNKIMQNNFINEMKKTSSFNKKNEINLTIKLNEISDIKIDKKMKDIIKIHNLFLKYSFKNNSFSINKLIYMREINEIKMNQNEKIKAALCHYFAFNLILENNKIIEFIFINFEQFNLWKKCFEIILKINKTKNGAISYKNLFIKEDNEKNNNDIMYKTNGRDIKDNSAKKTNETKNSNNINISRNNSKLRKCMINPYKALIKSRDK